MFSVDRAASKVGAARKCSAGMAVADPINVCGRLNFHRTFRNEGLTILLSPIDVAEAFLCVVVSIGNGGAVVVVRMEDSLMRPEDRKDH